MSLGISFSDISNIETDAVFDQDVMIDSISTDTRDISSGETYLAIKGDRFDGHDYISEAISSGASSVVISRRDMQVDRPSLKVNDTVVTLGNIANLYRNRLAATVIGITGSNGKTTVKGMVAGIAEVHGRTTYTRENQNNMIGAPLTLLDADLEDKTVVVEMGTSERGEIAYLSKIVSPDIALINNISESHLEGLGLRDDVFREKSEIIRFTKKNGAVILNADDQYTGEALKLLEGRKVLTFGLDNPADISAGFQLSETGSQVNVTMPGGNIAYRLSVPGKHNVVNSLAAVAIACAANIDREHIISGLQEYSGVKGRLHVVPIGKKDSWLIDDSYNANPSSTSAALDVLSGYPGRKIFVFGGMAELGPDAHRLHREIGEKAGQAGVDLMYTLSGDAEATQEAFANNKFVYSNTEEICKALFDEVHDGDVILVKGSRRYGMDKVSKYLQESIK